MAGSWSPLVNQPPFAASTMLLLTNGRVMCQDENRAIWWGLTPDAKGSYLNAYWDPLASMRGARMYYGSAVLADGRVLVVGGEYAGGENTEDIATGEIYDPYFDSWSDISVPAGWYAIGDAPLCVLFDGSVLLGSINDCRTAIYDPVGNFWRQGGMKEDCSSEETWTLLPDGCVLTVECSNHPSAEKYIPASNRWVSAGRTPVDLVDAPSIEIGPALLLQNGSVFAVGASGKTALYTSPKVPDQPGSWIAGPTMVDGTGRVLHAKDAPGCLLPNGRVLCVAGPPAANKDDYPSDTYFFEFDPTSNSLKQIFSPETGSLEPFPGCAYESRMLLLPTGEVLFAGKLKASGESRVYMYQPEKPDPKLETLIQPKIEHLQGALEGNTTILNRGETYLLRGKRFNGVSQAVSYGDDATMATNYPLARLLKKGVSGAPDKVWYCRTFNQSTMGVATGDLGCTTNFQVPQLGDADLGAMDLFVVANGAASDSFPVTIK
jgi:hypothetical protein